jgi:LAO/AO transport system kinase
VRTVATTGDGIDDFCAAINAHRAYLEGDDRLAARRHARIAAELRAIVAERLLVQAGAVCSGPEFEKLVDEVAARTKDPYEAADAIVGP